MKRFADGPLDNSPSQDAVHPYDYDTSQNYTPGCPNCQRKMILTTQPLTPFKAFTCPDCSFSIPYSQRGDTGTLVGETGTEHLQSFEGLVEKSNKDQPLVHAPYKTTKRPKENPMADPEGHGVLMDRTLTADVRQNGVKAFQADQPFPRMIHQEMETRNQISNIIYGLTYFQLTVGQKDRVDRAMRIFWDSHGLFSAQQVVNYMRRMGLMLKQADVLDFLKKKETDAPKKGEERGVAEMSAKEIAVKKILAVNDKLETLYAAVALMNEQVKDYQAKLRTKLGIPKLEEEAKGAEEYMNELARLLEQKEFLLGNMVYTFKTSSERLVSALRSVEKVNAAIATIEEIVSPKKMARYQEIVQDFTKMEPIAESFSAYLETEEKKRPKELQAPELEKLSPEQLTKLMETPQTKSSLNVMSASFWDTIKGWFNSLKALAADAIGLVSDDLALLQEVQADLEAGFGEI